jgi:hypothetical protein
MYYPDTSVETRCGVHWKWGAAAGFEWRHVRTYLRVNDVGARSATEHRCLTARATAACASLRCARVERPPALGACASTAVRTCTADVLTARPAAACLRVRANLSHRTACAYRQACRLLNVTHASRAPARRRRKRRAEDVARQGQGRRPPQRHVPHSVRREVHVPDVPRRLDRLVPAAKDAVDLLRAAARVTRAARSGCAIASRDVRVGLAAALAWAFRLCNRDHYQSCPPRYS